MKKGWLVVFIFLFFFSPKVIFAESYLMDVKKPEFQGSTNIGFTGEDRKEMMRNAISCFETYYPGYDYLAVSPDGKTLEIYYGQNININGMIYKLRFIENHWRYYLTFPSDDLFRYRIRIQYFTDLNHTNHYNNVCNTMANRTISEENISIYYHGLLDLIVDSEFSKALNMIFLKSNISNIDNFLGYDSSLNETYNDIGLIYDNNLLSLGDKIPYEFYEEKKPEILFTYEDVYIGGQLYSAFVNTYFTVLDFDKYKYEYSIDSTSNFKEINEDDMHGSGIVDGILYHEFSYRFIKNGTIFIQILDRQSNEYITSATFNVSHLPDTTPDIIFEELEYCGFKHGTNFSEEDFILCSKLSFTITKPNLSEYNVFYRIGENGKWNITYDETTSLELYENTRVYVKIEDKATGEEIILRYYDVTSIATAEEITAPKVQYRINFNVETFVLTHRYFFLNYDPSKYEYFYGYAKIDSNIGKLTKIEGITIQEGTGPYYTKDYDYLTEGNVIIEIRDLEGNWIATYNFHVDYDHYMEDNDLDSWLDNIEVFFDGIVNTCDYVGQVFSMFFGQLGTIFQSFIITVFILFLVFAILKMGGWI